MTAGTSSVPTSQQEHKAAFFRHSGWLIMTTLAGGALTWGVHFLSKRVPEDEWGVFLALLAVTMCIPANPLQMVFAQQTAAAIATRTERQLAGKIRLAWLGTSGLCVIGALLLYFAQHQIMAHWKIRESSALWITLLGVLLNFWMPMFLGVMQGQQNFLWFGWGMMANGFGRVCVSVLIAFAVAASAAGLMAGVAAGFGVAALIGMWQTRKLWSGPTESFDWRALLGQVLPLMIGFGAGQFLFSADMMYVKNYFTEDQAAHYGAAGTLSRALVWFVGPLTAVMFPKIVHSSARAEKTDLMGLTLLCTAVLAIVGAAGLWVLGPYLVRFVYRPDFIPTATAVLPWYAGAMLPYCLANVLLSNLLAKSDFRVVPIAVCLAIAYAVTLTYAHSSLIMVLQMVGLFNLGLLVAAAWFTWVMKRMPQPGART